jgi:glutaminyl-tRNA synthetase
VRLRYAYYVTCTDVIKDESGEVVELRCTYDPATRGGDAPDGRKVKATLHWVSASYAARAEIRLYDHLFARENPNDVGKAASFVDNVNPNSKEILTDCPVEPSLKSAAPGERFQFERLGYFCVDKTTDAATERLAFNRTVTLRDTWAKIKKQMKQSPIQ